MNTENMLIDLTSRVAQLEQGQRIIFGMLAALALPIYTQFVNSVARKMKGRNP